MKNNSKKMSIFFPVVEKMGEVRKDLPGNWAETIAQEMGLRVEVVWAYAAGRRGKRNREKALEILRRMKTLKKRFENEIKKETA